MDEIKTNLHNQEKIVAGLQRQLNKKPTKTLEEATKIIRHQQATHASDRTPVDMTKIAAPSQTLQDLTNDVAKGFFSG